MSLIIIMIFTTFIHGYLLILIHRLLQKSQLQSPLWHLSRGTLSCVKDITTLSIVLKLQCFEISIYFDSVKRPMSCTNELLELHYIFTFFKKCCFVVLGVVYLLKTEWTMAQFSTAFTGRYVCKYDLGHCKGVWMRTEFSKVCGGSYRLRHNYL